MKICMMNSVDLEAMPSSCDQFSELKFLNDIVSEVLTLKKMDDVIESIKVLFAKRIKFRGPGWVQFDWFTSVLGLHVTQIATGKTILLVQENE